MKEGIWDPYRAHYSRHVWSIRSIVETAHQFPSRVPPPFPPPWHRRNIRIHGVLLLNYLDDLAGDDGMLWVLRCDRLAGWLVFSLYCPGSGPSDRWGNYGCLGAPICRSMDMPAAQQKFLRSSLPIPRLWLIWGDCKPRSLVSGLQSLVSPGRTWSPRGRLGLWL